MSDCLYGYSTESGNQRALQVNSTTNCDLTELLLRGEVTTMAEPELTAGSSGQRWTSANEQRTTYIEPNCDLVDTNTQTHADSIARRQSHTNELNHDRSNTRTEPCLLPRPDFRGPSRLCQFVSLTELHSSVPPMASVHEAERHAESHSLSYGSAGPMYSDRQRVCEAMDLESLDNSPLEATVTQNHNTAGLGFKICSTDFVNNLRSLLFALHTPSSAEVNLKSDDIIYVSQAIDRLERGHQMTIIRRRILLWRFAVLRENIRQQVIQRRASELTHIRPTGVGSIDNEVVDILFMQLHPADAELQPRGSISLWRHNHRSKRKDIHNRRDAAKNWQQAVLRYGLGILVLLPSDGKTEWRGWRYTSKSLGF